MNLHVVAAEFVLESGDTVSEKWFTLFLLVFFSMALSRGIGWTFWRFSLILWSAFIAVLAIGGLMLFSNERDKPGELRVSADISRSPGVAVERTTEDGTAVDQDGQSQGSGFDSGGESDSFSHSHSHLDDDRNLADHTHP